MRNRNLGKKPRFSQKTAAALAALTSFEFYDALAADSPDEPHAAATILELSQHLLARR
jgi:hypothetical protein